MMVVQSEREPSTRIGSIGVVDDVLLSMSDEMCCIGMPYHCIDTSALSPQVNNSTVVKCTFGRRQASRASLTRGS